MKNQKGFTLMEVMVAILILTVILGPVSLYLSRNLTHMVEVRDASIALNLAKEGMEKVRSGEYPDSYEITVNNTTWRTEYTFVPDTAPLEVQVKVFKESATEATTELVSLVESL